jgi:hypothetical protein
VVGDAGVAMHFDGSSWSTVEMTSINNLLTVWASSTSDAWIGGDLGLLLHYDGTTWNEVASGVATAFLSIRGASATKAWSSDENGSIRLWDGKTWSGRIGSTNGNHLGVSSDKDVWSNSSGYGYHFDGSSWTYFGFGGGAVNQVWSSSSTNGWIFQGSDIYHFNGTNFTGSW